MAVTDSNSPILNLLLMGDGLHSNDWGDQNNANLSLLEQAMKGINAIAVTGNATLTKTQVAAGILNFTGTLTSNTTITIPEEPGLWIVFNNTSGAYSLTMTTGIGSSVVLPQGGKGSYCCDSTNVFNAAAQTDIVPVGATIAYPSLTSPNSNYHLCDGTAISRTAYPALYALIGTAFGSGDGFTTFNLPDLNGRTIAGADNSSGRLNSWIIGQSGGNNGGSVTISTANLPAHNHPVNDNGHTHTDTGHTHSILTPSSTSTNGGIANASYVNSAGNTGTGHAAISTSTTGITTANTGTGTAINTLPPVLVMAYHIRIQ